MANERVLDCVGLPCPQPVIQAKDTLAEMASGDTLKVIVDNEAALKNVSFFVENQGHAVNGEEKNGGTFYLEIQKVKGVAERGASEVARELPIEKTTVVNISSETMGQGDDELGRILMGAYFETLSHFAKEITHIIFINSGVKLAVEGSPVLEELQSLEKMGIEVLCCGTCLNHFGIQEKLKTGSISNMFTIMDTLSKAGKILTP